MAATCSGPRDGGNILNFKQMLLLQIGRDRQRCSRPQVCRISVRQVLMRSSFFLSSEDTVALLRNYFVKRTTSHAAGDAIGGENYTPVKSRAAACEVARMFNLPCSALGFGLSLESACGVSSMSPGLVEPRLRWSIDANNVKVVFSRYSRPASTAFMPSSSFLISSGDNSGRSTLIVSLFNSAVSGNGGW